MNARALTLLTGLIWLGAATAAPPDPSVIERAVETSSTVTSIPTALGAISARSCTQCPTRFLTLTGESKFYVGRSAVPFADFKALAGDPRGHSMTLYYRVVDNTVTRVVIAAD
ncbi:MAG: hypothetical protein ACREXP_07355 [Steroidobacteraceae bacterium]